MNLKHKKIVAFGAFLLALTMVSMMSGIVSAGAYVWLDGNVNSENLMVGTVYSGSISDLNLNDDNKRKFDSDYSGGHQVVSVAWTLRASKWGTASKVRYEVQDCTFNMVVDRAWLKIWNYDTESWETVVYKEDTTFVILSLTKTNSKYWSESGSYVYCKIHLMTWDDIYIHRVRVDFVDGDSYQYVPWL